MHYTILSIESCNQTEGTVLYTPTKKYQNIQKPAGEVSHSYKYINNRGQASKDMCKYFCQIEYIHTVSIRKFNYFPICMVEEISPLNMSEGDTRNAIIRKITAILN